VGPSKPNLTEKETPHPEMEKDIPSLTSTKNVGKMFPSPQGEGGGLSSREKKGMHREAPALPRKTRVLSSRGGGRKREKRSSHCRKRKGDAVPSNAGS